MRPYDETLNPSFDLAGLGLAGYRPHAGTHDEMVDASGQVRPLWRPLIAHLQDLGREGVERARARAEQYLRDSGVFYRRYGAGVAIERPWPLNTLPVLISQADWTGLCEGLIARADALEALMADLYGENRLVAEGVLPAQLVATNPEWLRPLVGVTPRAGRYLQVISFEVGRGADGAWRVLADRTQAPSGAGYALENRIATSRAFPQLYAQMNVPRVAGYFRALRDALSGSRGEHDGRVAILTPGPFSETYYEHAWLARHLGVALVQGEDLAVSEGRLMLRTVSGLRPLEVLWRKLDSGFADPLELEPSSRLGTAGMVSAVRQGKLSVVNALGSGVLECRALMAYFPALAGHLTGRALTISGAETLWCGEAAARERLLDAPRGWILSSLSGRGISFDGSDRPIRADELSRDALAALLARDGASLVAQESLGLSTTPTLDGGTLQPRPVSLRIFLTRTPQGWQVMQGGLARVGSGDDASAGGLQAGGTSADIWVVGDQPAPPEVPQVQLATITERRVELGELPSRAADNLFWLGRYVERAEGTIRLLRARHMRIAEMGRADAALIDGVDRLLLGRGLAPPQPIPQALLATFASALGSAGQVRDRFSTDGWAALTDLDKTARRMAERVSEGADAASALSALLRKLAGFSGLVHENMYQFLGWRFLSIGRQHERAMGMCEVLRGLADPAAPAGALDLCLEAGDAVLTHRRRYVGVASRDSVVELMALDPLNPRSIRNQIDAMAAQVDKLPSQNAADQLSPLGRAMMRLRTTIATETPESLGSAALAALETHIADISDLMTETYFR